MNLHFLWLSTFLLSNLRSFSLKSSQNTFKEFCFAFRIIDLERKQDRDYSHVVFYKKMNLQRAARYHSLMKLLNTFTINNKMHTGVFVSGTAHQKTFIWSLLTEN